MKRLFSSDRLHLRNRVVPFLGEAGGKNRAMTAIKMVRVVHEIY